MNQPSGTAGLRFKVYKTQTPNLIFTNTLNQPRDIGLHPYYVVGNTTGGYLGYVDNSGVWNYHFSDAVTGEGLYIIIVEALSSSGSTLGSDTKTVNIILV